MVCILEISRCVQPAIWPIFHWLCSVALRQPYKPTKVRVIFLFHHFGTMDCIYLASEIIVYERTSKTVTPSGNCAQFSVARYIQISLWCCNTTQPSARRSYLMYYLSQRPCCNAAFRHGLKASSYASTSFVRSRFVSMFMLHCDLIHLSLA